MEKKKEAIALLSMYNDEDMDPDDEDDGSDDDGGNDAGVAVNGDAGEVDDGRGKVDKIDEDMDEADAVRSVDEGVGLPEKSPAVPMQEDAESVRPSFPNENLFRRSPSPFPLVTTSTPPTAVFVESDMRRSTNGGGLTIVDYAHDEGAMSPDPEEGEIPAAGRVTFGAELQASNDASQYMTPPGSVRIMTPSKNETVQSVSQSEELKYEVDSRIESDGIRQSEADQNIDVEEKPTEEVLKENMDPLEKFLPPPPSAKCSAELQAKIVKFLGLMNAGRNFNEELRKSKGYRNPDFLQHAVSYQEIDQLGTCFRKDVFDPYGYDKSDYYDEIEAEMKRELERKEQEKKKNQKIEFAQGGLLPTPVVTAPKAQVPASILSASSVAVNLSSLHPAPTTGDVPQKELRQNKKSKWDKVDGDRKLPLPAGGGQDPVSAVGAHAALLSAANAGAGYTAFAQQKRKEAAEKRSSEKVGKDSGK
ncbi:uncharacterized protein LOC116267334 [Nymphaea colorata]|nr:uncharacterized protein LOC116267334 [Nymphaea colorata]